MRLAKRGSPELATGRISNRAVIVSKADSLVWKPAECPACRDLLGLLNRRNLVGLDAVAVYGGDTGHCASACPVPRE